MTQLQPHKFCPFGSVYQTGPAGSWVKKLPPCDLDNCALGIPENGRCAIKDLAGTSNATYLIHGNQHVQDALVIQTIRDFGSRLSAILAHLAGYTPPVPEQHTPDAPRSDEPAPPLCPYPPNADHLALQELVKHLRETPYLEGLVSIEHMLTHIHRDLERISPPTKNADSQT